MANNFDILKTMGERNLDIRLAPLTNILNVRKVKAGTQITIGVDGDVVGAIGADAFVGGLILANRKQFTEIKAEMEKSNDSKGD